MRPGARRIAQLAATPIALALVTLLLAPHDAVAAAPVNFVGTIGEQCVTVLWPAGRHAHLDWAGADGATKASAPVGRNGSADVCAPEGLGLMIGDRLTLSAGATSRRFVVPTLTLNIDRVRGVFSGEAPARYNVWISWHYEYDDSGNDRRINVRPDGTWSLRPRDGMGDVNSASLVAQSPKGDVLSTPVAFRPQITLAVGNARFFGRSSAFAVVVVSLTDAASGEVTTASAFTDAYGEFAGKFRDPHGRQVRIDPGDEVDAPAIGSDAHWTVPRIRASADAATDVVRGRCQDTGMRADWVDIAVWRPGNHTRGYGETTVDAHGRFALDMTHLTYPWDRANIKPGDRAAVYCGLTSGDSAQLVIGVP